VHACWWHSPRVKFSFIISLARLAKRNVKRSLGAGRKPHAWLCSSPKVNFFFLFSASFTNYVKWSQCHYRHIYSTTTARPHAGRHGHHCKGKGASTTSIMPWPRKHLARNGVDTSTHRARCHDINRASEHSGSKTHVAHSFFV
jgi:hypothetical protein